MGVGLLGLLATGFMNSEYCKNRLGSILQEADCKAYTWVIVLFFGAVLVSAMVTDGVISGLGFWVRHWLWRFLIFFLAIILISKAEAAKRVIPWLLAGVSISSVYMLVEILVHYKERAAGLYGNAMVMGGIFSIVFPLILILLINRELLELPSFVMPGILVFCSLGILLNGTRGAWVACGISALCILLAYANKAPRTVLSIFLAFTLFCGSALVNDNIRSRVLSVGNVTTDHSNTARLYMWRGAVAMFKDNAVLGVGEEQYQEQVRKFYQVPGQNAVYEHAHSNIFHMLCSYGLLGLLSMLLMFGTLIWLSLKSFINYGND